MHGVGPEEEEEGRIPEVALRKVVDGAVEKCASGLRIRCSAPRHAEARPTIGVPPPVVVAIEPGGEAEAAVDVPAVGKRPGLQARLPELLGERRPLRRDPPARVGGAVAVRVHPG